MKRLLLIVSAFLMPYFIYAQVNGIQFIPPSAASLMKVADFPVGSNNGIPEISLPLHTLSSGNLSLDLTLNFNIDSYLQANQLPDSPGAGWSLSSDIQISRQIRGGDDFGIWGYYSNPHIPSGFDGTVLIDADQEYRSGAYVRGYDEEPDKFYYRLLNKVGIFYFRKNSDGMIVPVNVPSNGVRIEYTKVGNRQSFTLIDTDGTIYNYSSDYIDRENLSGDDLAPALTWKCDNIISASKTDTITFRYVQLTPPEIFGYTPSGIDVYDQYSCSAPVFPVTSGSTSNPYNNYSPVYMLCPYGPMPPPECGEIAPPVEGTALSPPTSIVTNPKYIYNEATPLNLSGRSQLYIYDVKTYRQAFNYINPESVNISQTRNFCYNYTSEIHTRNGSIHYFYKSPSSPALDSIIVVTPSGERIKSISFQQNYAYDPNQGIVNDKWNLHSRRLDTLAINGEVFSFLYSRNHYCGIFPDFWGYPTDPVMFYGSPVVPRHDVTVDFGASSSFTDGSTSGFVSIGTQIFPLGYQSTESLLSITYPMGGTVRFFTERNRYLDKNGEIYPAGGYRIVRIDFHDNISSAPVRQKIYRYGHNENGCGIMKEIPNFDHLTGNCMTTQQLNYYCAPNSMQPTIYRMFGSERKRTYLSSPVYSADCGTGNWICYSEIAEYDSEDGMLSGKTVYYYDVSSLADKIHRPAECIGYPLEEHTWDVGALDSVVFYKNESGTFIPSRSISYAYHEYQEPERIFQARVWPSVLAVPVGFGGPEDLYFDSYLFHKDHSEFIYNYNSLAVGCMQLASTTEKYYENDGSVRSSFTEYNYSNTNTSYRPTSISLTDWNGSKTETHTICAADYIIPGTDTVSVLYEKNIIEKPIEEVSIRDGVVISATLNIYDTDGDIVKSYALKDPGLQARSFRMSNRQSYDGAESQQSSFNPDYSNYYLTGTATYDYSKRLRELHLLGEPSVHYLWGYNNMYPIAQIVGAKWEDIEYVVNAMNYNNLQDLFSALREQLQESLVTGYTYKVQMGISSVTDPSGRTTYYEYDSQGRLSSVRDEAGRLMESYEYTLKNTLP